jgi:hypothetical protein
MPKNKKPVPRKSHTPPQEKEEALSQALSELALTVAEQEYEDMAEHELEFTRQIRRYLNQQKNEVLYGALEQARFEDSEAYRVLREAIEEHAGSVLLHRENGPEMEINAFAIPVFVHSQGGLSETEGFQDEQAYEALLEGFRSGGLESPQARLVLVQHAYDLGEAERISYGQLNAMVREAAMSLTDKKLREAPALQRSIAGWAPSSFGANDEAVELRFLLGFACKRADDPFYRIPQDEAAQDEYWGKRMERYRAWTETAAPLVARCLARGDKAQSLRLNFLYQDLFFGALQQGRSEHATLAMMAQFGDVLRAHGGAARAVVTGAEQDGEAVLRVQLFGGNQLLASADRPYDPGSDLEAEIDDLRDALSTLGVSELAAELTSPK